MIEWKKIILHHTNETGEWLWAIVDTEDEEMWLASFDTKGNALIYCRMNCLEIIDIVDDKIGMEEHAELMELMHEETEEET